VLPVYHFLQFLIEVIQDLKLKYYELMIQHALKHDSYLDVTKYYYKVWETPSIKEDETDKGRTVRSFYAQQTLFLKRSVDFGTHRLLYCSCVPQ
jgi:hypothetical protein